MNERLQRKSKRIQILRKSHDERHHHRQQQHSKQIIILILNTTTTYDKVLSNNFHD